jgi:hypothetical protein
VTEEEACSAVEKDGELALRMIDEAGGDQPANRRMAAPWAPGVEEPLGKHLLPQGKPVNRSDPWG